MGMYGKEFAFFLQVCKDGSIRKAAKSLYISPQGLGKALTTLEQDLGVQLFQRNKDGIRLTDKGEEIRPFIESIVDNLYAIHSSVEQQSGKVAGELNLACSLGVMGQLSQALFTDFRILYPEVTLNVTEGSDQKVQDLVATSNGKTIGISVGPCLRKDLEEHFLASYNLVWLINKRNPLAAKDQIHFADLKDQKLAMYSEEFVTYHRAMAGCEKAGITPDCAYFINEAIMAYKFCKRYNAVAVTVDFIAEDVAVEDIVIKPMLDPDCKWDLYLIRQANSQTDEVQRLFTRYLLKTTAQLQPNRD